MSESIWHRFSKQLHLIQYFWSDSWQFRYDSKQKICDADELNDELRFSSKLAFTENNIWVFYCILRQVIRHSTKPKQLVQELPILHIIPIESHKLKLQNTFRTPGEHNGNYLYWDWLHSSWNWLQFTLHYNPLIEFSSIILFIKNIRNDIDAAFTQEPRN